MFDIIITLITAGPVVGLSLTWLVLRYRQPDRPMSSTVIASQPADFLSVEQRSRLKQLEEYQEQCRVEKAELYLIGDRDGLNRRTSDGRFDARGRGRQLNNTLATLDRHFADAEDERFGLLSAAYHVVYKSAVAEAKWDWYRRYFRKVEMEFIAYVGCVIGVALILPSWALFVSEFAENHFLLPLPLPSLAYGAIFLTSLCSVVPLFIVTSNGVWETIPNQGSPLGESESRVTEFAEAPEVADFEPDDYAEDQDQDTDEDNANSPYEVLGVKPTATRDEIMTAYRKLVRQYHPDYLQERGDELKQLADRKMKEFNLAKEEALRAL